MAGASRHCMTRSAHLSERLLAVGSCSRAHWAAARQTMLRSVEVSLVGGEPHGPGLLSHILTDRTKRSQDQFGCCSPGGFVEASR